MIAERVLITGGTGFLGKHVVSQLYERGYRVRMLVRNSSDISWLNGRDIELAYGDVTDYDSVCLAVKDCDYVVHGAGFFRFWGQHEIFDSINVEGTVNIASAVLKFKVKRMIHISTVAVVGNPDPGQIIDETTICHPQSPYQHSKLTAEHRLLALIEKKNLPVIILRPGAFYGPGSEYGFNRLFVVEALQGWRVKVEGGKRLTFPVYVPDVAEVIISSMKNGKVGSIYNVSGDSLTHNEVNRISSELLNISQWRFNVGRFPMIILAALQELLAKITRREPFYPLNLRHYVFNDWDVRSDKAKKDLNFSPTPIEQGLKETIDWIRKHHDS